MKNEDPLRNIAQVHKINSCNKSGRPLSSSIIKFSPQPQSTVSLKICEEKQKLLIHDDLYDDSTWDEGTIELFEHNIQNKAHLIDNVENYKSKNTIPENLQADYDTLPKFKKTFHKIRDMHPKIMKLKTMIGDKSDLDIKLKKRSKNSTIGIQKKPRVKYLNRCSVEGCNYITKLSSNLTKHKRIHTNEKPYLCDKCTFRSNFVSSLKVHKRIHTSERPFGCEHCGYRCNSSSNLKKHIYHKHSKQKC